MKSVSLHKENAYLFVFLMISIIALAFVQSNKVDVQSEHTSTILSQKAEEFSPEKTAKRQEVTTKHLHGELVTTDITPEAGKQITFYLTKYTPDPNAKYYLQIGSRKILFNGGSLKHTFNNEGMVKAELFCSFEGQEHNLDHEFLEVTKKMQNPPLANLLEN